MRGLVAPFSQMTSGSSNSTPSDGVTLFAVGTTNNAKIRAVEGALLLLQQKTNDPRFQRIQVQGIQCSSQVSAQPLDTQETLQGAMNRAKQAQILSNAEFGIGIESGLERIQDRWFECGWICVQDRQGNLGFGSSNRYEIREPLMERIRQGKELSTAIEELTGLDHVKTTLGMSGVITHGIVNRDDSYRDALLFAFAPFVSDPRLWK
jgi:inosine/xanthosine triphosphatase